ncbi:hypothetical protein [Corallococcus sp. AS-1-12]|nr:hypothetical protein [Corallococcus sp. AS-1-12]MBZ4331773.1 hypothetical protein [Corallococcus sp. AS-1-12]
MRHTPLGMKLRRWAGSLHAPVNGLRYLVCEGACEAKMNALIQKHAPK